MILRRERDKLNNEELPADRSLELRWISGVTHLRVFCGSKDDATGASNVVRR